MIRSILALACFAACLFSGCGHSAAERDVTQAMTLYSQREFEQAITHLENALEHRLDAITRSDVLTTIGNCYCEIDQLAKAIEYHNAALKDNPLNYQAHVNKGVVYRLMEDFDEAEKSFEDALLLAPKYAELYVSMGDLALHQEEYEKAITHLEKAIELDDQLPVAHSNLALAYANVGKFAEAEEELRKAEARNYHQPAIIQTEIERLRLESIRNAQ